MLRESVNLPPGESSDPLTYLDGFERALCGWAVVRAFRLRTPRFRTVLKKYGPEGGAYYACIQVFCAYCFPLVVVGFALATLSPGLSDLSFGLIGLSLLLAIRRIFSLHRAGKEYRGE